MSEPNLNDILSGGGLSSLLQNPDVAAKLPRIMEALAPVMAEMRAEQNAAGEGKEETAKSSDDAKENAAKSAEQLLAALPQSGGGKHKSGAAAHRHALLRALEPYLSDDRRAAMDYITKVLSLIDILSEVM